MYIIHYWPLYFIWQKTVSRFHPSPPVSKRASLEPFALPKVAVHRGVEPGVQMPEPEPAAAEVQAPPAADIAVVAPEEEKHPDGDWGIIYPLFFFGRTWNFKWFHKNDDAPSLVF